MPSAKSGKSSTLVPPADPEPTIDADDAHAGGTDAAAAARQRATDVAKAAAAAVKPFQPGTDDDGKPKTGWIEVAVIDEAGQPVPGLAYAVTLPDGSVASGTLDANGVARVEGFDPGSCQVTFPDLDQEAWVAA